MSSVGVFQAKARLSELISQVQRGEDVIITRHGHPVARLVSAKEATETDRVKAVAALRKFSKGIKTGKFDLSAIVAAGRR